MEKCQIFKLKHCFTFDVESLFFRDQLHHDGIAVVDGGSVAVGGGGSVVAGGGGGVGIVGGVVVCVPAHMSPFQSAAGEKLCLYVTHKNKLISPEKGQCVHNILVSPLQR